MTDERLPTGGEVDATLDGIERERGRVLRFLEAEEKSWRAIGAHAKAALVADLIAAIRSSKHTADRFEKWGEG